MSGKPPVNAIVNPLSNTPGMEKSKGFPSYRVNIVVPKSKNGALFERNPTSTDPRVGKWIEPSQGGRRTHRNRRRNQRNRRRSQRRRTHRR